MKIRVCADTGANIHSKWSEEIDVEEGLGLTDEEWNKLTDSEKEKVVYDYCSDSGWIQTWWERSNSATASGERFAGVSCSTLYCDKGDQL
jgi:hypothetical protein